MLSFVMRSFALSLSIFWRALPAWVALFAILYALFSFLSNTPFIFFFLLMLGMGTLTVYMIFVHIRSGLIVADEVTPTDLGKLFKRSFKFFRFFAMFNLLVTAVSVVAFVGASRVGVFDLELVQEAILSGSADALAELEAQLSSPAAYAYFTVSQILSQLAYCALAVPMAANAHACTPKGRDCEVFWGFGAYTFRMFLLVLITGTLIVGLVLAYGFLLFTMPVFDGLSVLQIESMDDFTMPTSIASYAMLGALVLFPIAGFVWMVSLWCAGATVCFLDHRDRRQMLNNQEIACVYEKPLSGEELRALRMARMTGVHA